MILSDLERLIEIFNDSKHCTISLRQLSFLCVTYLTVMPRSHCESIEVVKWLSLA